MKLYKIEVMDDCDCFTYLKVSDKSKEDLEIEIKNNDEYNCFIYCDIEEVTEVDGYKIIVERL